MAFLGSAEIVFHSPDSWNTAQRCLMAFMGQLKRDAESIWQVEMQIINHPRDLLSFSTSSAGLLNSPTAGREIPHKARLARFQ